MTGQNIRDARDKPGFMWGSRALSAYVRSLAEPRGSVGHDADATVRDREREKSTITGPVSATVSMIPAISIPPDSLDEIVLYRGESDDNQRDRAYYA